MKWILVLGLVLFGGLATDSRPKTDASIVPFGWDDERMYVTASADGSKYWAMIDTGSQDTLLSSRLPYPPPYRHEQIRDYHGVLQVVPVTNMKICVGGFCDYEDVAIVDNLTQDMVLRGVFFQHADQIIINYVKMTIEIDGWER